MPPARAWGRTSTTDRSRVLLRIADRMEEKARSMLALVETIDNGKPIRETTAADVPLAIDHFRYFAGCLRAQEGGISEIDHDTIAYHFHEPLGVVGQIIPWNFPLLMAVWKLAPALGRGQLHRAEAGRADAHEHHGADGHACPTSCPSRRGERGQRVRPGMRQAAGAEQADCEDCLHRRDQHRPVDHAICQSENIIPVTLELGGKSPNIFFADVAAEDDAFFDKALEGLHDVCAEPGRGLHLPQPRAGA